MSSQVVGSNLTTFDTGASLEGARFRTATEQSLVSTVTGKWVSQVVQGATTGARYTYTSTLKTLLFLVLDKMFNTQASVVPHSRRQHYKGGCVWATAKTPELALIMCRSYSAEVLSNWATTYHCPFTTSARLARLFCVTPMETADVIPTVAWTHSFGRLCHALV